MTRIVLSTPEGEAAYRKMEQIINGELQTAIRQLNQQGELLSNPKVWDGNNAEKFRGTWAQAHKSLQKFQADLLELKQTVQKINENIQLSGNN
jgi:uncharacterized protein YukE